MDGEEAHRGKGGGGLRWPKEGGKRNSEYLNSWIMSKIESLPFRYENLVLTPL